MCDCCAAQDCNSCCDAEDGLDFLYCRVCNKKVALVNEDGNPKTIKCCGSEMINLTNIPSSIGNVLECKKCKAKVIIEDDCNCFLENKEHSFNCCGEKMDVVGQEDTSCSCEEDECGCDDDTSFLTCTECKVLVSVLNPCTCTDCGITCCGKQMTDPQTLKAHSGELFECKQCGVKMVIEEENFFEDESTYKSVTCCGQAMVNKGESEESENLWNSETNTALFCPSCERIIITDEKNAGKMACCEKTMIDINSIEDYSGEMFECKKCKSKVIIEEDSMTEKGNNASGFECCGQAMVGIKE